MTPTTLKGPATCHTCPRTTNTRLFINMVIFICHCKCGSFQAFGNLLEPKRTTPPIGSTPGKSPLYLAKRIGRIRIIFWGSFASFLTPRVSSARSWLLSAKGKPGGWGGVQVMLQLTPFECQGKVSASQTLRYQGTFRKPSDREATQGSAFQGHTKQDKPPKTPRARYLPTKTP